METVSLTNKKEQKINHKKKNMLGIEHHEITHPKVKINFINEPGLNSPPFNSGLLSDIYRNIKHQLLKQMSSPFIMVTSASDKEGKSLAAINLTTSFSLDKDWNACLIDCSGNLKNCIQKLGVKPTKGLLDYLDSDEDSINQYIFNTQYDSIKLLPHGNDHALRFELLTSNKMKHLIYNLSKTLPNTIFIIDSPSLTTAESQFLANQVDHIILLIEQGGTAISKIKSLINEVADNKIAGVLYNKASKISIT